MRRVEVEDDADQRAEQDRRERAALRPGEVDVGEIPDVEVREGEGGEHDQQHDIDGGDHDRRGDRRVQRAARQEVEPDPEEDDHPGRGGQHRRIGKGGRDPDVEDQQQTEREGHQDGRQDGRARAAEVVGDDGPDERVAVADAAAPRDNLDHRGDRHHVDKPERDDQRDPGQRPHPRHRDRQGEVDSADDQRDEERQPEGRERVQPPDETRGGPAQPVGGTHLRRVDGLQRRSEHPLVRLLDGFRVQAQGLPQARNLAVRNEVLRPEQVRHPGPGIGVRRDQVGPVGGVAFELLDRRAHRQVAALRQRLEEGMLALPSGALAEHDGNGLLRTGKQVRGPVLDGEEERGGMTARHPAEQLVAREQRGLLRCHAMRLLRSSNRRRRPRALYLVLVDRHDVRCAP